MATVREPKEVVQRFLDHGSTADGWNMEIITECFSEHYWSHTWQGDLPATRALQSRFFAAFEFIERLSSDLIISSDTVFFRTRQPCTSTLGC